ncbi:GAF domain-containing protein [Methylobacterium sp. Leaf112]|uniref:GAF domain-containing protein n=1 Tax=Methylobacterium sp. Leaf112 TaxID=1736258 RepID=UPI0006F367A9|nr:GAF domain-containing protein [Methylobacterium sp. Leaf112]KQP62190.1 hypothetical protein ASF52_05945 [Methylobacterium sp. Leaf112]
MARSGGDPPGVSADEAERLSVLSEYRILDTPHEEAFDAIVRLATDLCGAPVGMITLVASDRQWFKARIGFDDPGTPLSHSICLHALPERTLLVIPDLTLDDRTLSNPAVTGAAAMRFYAGAPLRTASGHALGTLCVIDHAPRGDGLTTRQADSLRVLAGQVMTLFEARRALIAQEEAAEGLRAGAAFLKGILAATPDCIKVLDLEGRLTFMNDPGLLARDIDRFEPVEGKPWSGFWDGPEAAMAEEAVAAAQSGGAGRFEGWLATDGGVRKFWDVRVTPIMGLDDRPERLLVVSRDQTETHADAMRQSALATLGGRLREMTKASEVAACIAETAGRTLGLSQAAYGAVDPADGTIAFEQDWTRQGPCGDPGRHSPAHHGTDDDGLRRGSTVSIADVREDIRTASQADDLADQGIGAILNVPVMGSGRLVGVLCMHEAAPRAWTDRETTFAKAIAEQAGASLARISADEQQQLRTREVSHRFKNLLAMVQAIATQTMRSAGDVRAASNILAGRLAALGQAQDLLLGGELGSSPIHDVVRNALHVHVDAATRSTLSGPEMRIGGKVALSLSLMLHELATNAAKYGAFSTLNGGVAVAWLIVEGGDEPRVRLTWVEHGGPPVVAPTRKGFGSRLIERGLAGQVGGRVELSFHPTGLTFLIEAPLAAFEAEG